MNNSYSNSDDDSGFSSDYSSHYSRTNSQNLDEFDAHWNGISHESNAEYMEPVSKYRKESDSASNPYLLHD